MKNETNPSSSPIEKETRISAFEPQTVVLGVILSILSAIICMQIVGKVGVSANTSILGAIFAMLLARVPLASMKKFRSLERQNYIQTIVSGAGFAASNCAFTAVAILFVMGKTEVMLPMAIGCIFGTCISVFVVGRLYDSRIFPASEAWPPGVATASALQAGDEGGKKGLRVLQGIVVGIIGSFFKLPVGAVGIVFIANLPSMIALGIGLILRGYSTQLFGFDMGASKIPQGIMIGAGVVALIQSVVLIFKKSTAKGKVKQDFYTVSDQSAKVTIFTSFGIHIGGAILVGLLCGIFTGMSGGILVSWILWTAFASVSSMLLVGMAAMYSGWFPAFAITTIFMTIGVLMGFPPLAMAVLTGYISSVGPCFADMGYDLKTGWIIRGMGKNVEHEIYGRKQQVYIEMLGAFLGILVVIFLGGMMFDSGLVPPVSKVFVTAIEAGTSFDIVKEMAIWVLPGAIIQLMFGSKMVGVLLATGLLINNPIYGIGVIVAVLFRIIFGKKCTDFMDLRDAGLIAGDGLYSFFFSLFRLF